MKPIDYIKENNRLRELLNETNKIYYEDILIVIRTSFKEEKQSEEVLYELLSDLLQAQDNGLTAAEYFGIDAITLAHQLTDSMRKESLLNLFSMVFSGVMIFLQLRYTALLFTTPLTINPWQVVIDTFLFFILSCLVVWIIFKIMNQNPNGKHNYWLIFFVFIICMAILVGSQLLMQQWFTPMNIGHHYFSWIILGLNLLFTVITWIKDQKFIIYNHIPAIYCTFIAILFITNIINATTIERLPWLIILFIIGFIGIFTLQNINTISKSK